MELREQVESLAPAAMLAGADHVCRTLLAAGHRAYWVGGCVRDALLKRPLKDIDIATDARPEQVVALFEKARLVGASFGVVLVVEGEFAFDVATFRKDGRYLDFRHPETVEFGSLEDDVRRRDFTMNAIYYNPESGQIVDPEDGRTDLDLKLVRCVGDATARFREDALRLLRAVRFAARFDFQLAEPTAAAIRELAPNVQYISPERVRDELTAMFTGELPSRAIRMMDSLGLLEWVLPEVAALKGVEQGPEFHPEGDVYTHTLLALDMLEPRTPVLAWAVLYHDIAKPRTFRRWEDGGISFYDHEKVGAEMARTRLEQLRFPAETVDRVAGLVSRHMKFLSIEKMRRSTLRRFIGAPGFDEDLALHRADCMGSRGRLDYYHYAKSAIAEFAEAGHETCPPPLVNGDDLIAMGLRPSPRIGEILRQIHDEQLEGVLVTREDALAEARRLAAAGSAG